MEYTKKMDHTAYFPAKATAAAGQVIIARTVGFKGLLGSKRWNIAWVPWRDGELLPKTNKKIRTSARPMTA